MLPTCTPFMLSLAQESRLGPLTIRADASKPSKGMPGCQGVKVGACRSGSTSELGVQTINTAHIVEILDRRLHAAAVLRISTDAVDCGPRVGSWPVGQQEACLSYSDDSGRQSASETLTGRSIAGISRHGQSSNGDNGSARTGSGNVAMIATAGRLAMI
jgi:hypothetical protein